MRQRDPSTRLALIELPYPKLGKRRSSDVSLMLSMLLLRESWSGEELEGLPELKRTAYQVAERHPCGLFKSC